MGKNLEIPDVKKALEQIASEMCVGYCKFPEQYVTADADEEDQMAKLVQEHCEMCPIVQLFL